MIKYNVIFMYTDRNFNSFSYSYFVKAHNQQQAAHNALLKHQFLDEIEEIAIRRVKHIKSYNRYKVTITDIETDEIYTYFRHGYGPIEASEKAERCFQQVSDHVYKVNVHKA